MIKDLQAIEETPPVTPPAECAVPEHVWNAVDLWLTYERSEVHQTCGLCGQTLFILNRNGDVYAYNRDQIRGVTLAHLIQAHRWTREGAPNV
jgi:hypothetical protein